MTRNRPGVADRLRRVPQTLRLAYATTRAAGPALLTATVGLQVLGIAALVAQLLIGRSILGQLTQHAALIDLVPRAIALLAAFAVSATSTAVVTVLQRMLAETVSKHAMSVVLDAATQTDLIEFESAALHDRLQRALLNAASRPTQMTLGLLTVISSLATFLAVGVTVAVLAPLLFAIAVLAAIPLSAIALGSSRALYDFAVRQTEADRQRLYLQLLLSSREWAKEVRAYLLGTALLRRWLRFYDNRLTDLRSVLRQRARRALLGVAAATAALAGALFALLWMVTTGRLSIAAAATAATGLLLMSRQVQTLASGVATLYETALFLQDYRYFAGELDELRARASRESRAQRPPATVNGRGPARAGRTARPRPRPRSFHSLALRDVCFTYPAGHRPAVDHVSLDLQAGEIVALVGENGSGKSTLAKVISGLYAPTAGELRWNDVPYGDLDLDEIRKDVAILFQDFIKFQMSVRENITLGRIERVTVSDEAVRIAADTAGAADLVAELPLGYDTELGPQFVGGTELSGGQWQRLALARAAFRDASLVVLDEPTAALDPLAEERLFNSTRSIFAGKTVLLISHRFSSVRLADRIYVLERGRIVEVGTHARLMAAAGAYANMYRAQHEALLGPVEP